MPTLNESPLAYQSEESLIIDVRGERSPAEHVEDRLVQLLRRNPVTVSMTRGRSLCRDRSDFVNFVSE